MSDVRQEKSIRQSALSEVSTERLRTLIRNALLEGDEDDNAYLDTLTTEYLSRPGVPRADVNTAWQNFQNVMDGGEFKYTIVAPENHTQTEHVVRPQPTPQSHIRRARRSLRVAVIAAVIAVLLFALATAAGAFPAVRNAIAEWTERVFTFQRSATASSVGSGATSADSEYEDLQTALAANGITATLVPQWMPDGYELDSLDVTRNESWVNYSGAYADIDGILIIIQIVDYTNVNLSTSTRYHEKDGDDVITYDTNGVTHYIMSNNSRVQTTWAYDDYECSFTVPEDIPMESVTRMIDSIYKEN
jgi:hypothetical protein